MCSAVSCPADATFRSQTSSAGAPTSWAYFDILGRAVMKVAQTYDANAASQAFSAACSFYDIQSRPIYQSEPFFLQATIAADGSPVLTNSTQCRTTVYGTKTYYDILGRVIRVTNPDGGIIVKNYSGLVTTTSSPRNSNWVVTETRDALGEVVSTLDPVDSADTTTGLLVTQTYDAAGNVLTASRTTSGGAIVTSILYDALGRKYQVTDPDAGTTSYVYNAAGDIISQTDAKNQTIAQYYDALGRRWQRSAGGITDTWNFDTTTGNPCNVLHSCGLLASESRAQSGNPSFNRSMLYDGLGRLSQRVTSIAGNSYTETTAYDRFGRLSAQQDASGYSLFPEYSPSGFVGKQFDTRSGAVYQILGTDARGNVTSDERGGSTSLVSTIGFDPPTGHISSVCSGSNCGLQYLSYTFDVGGNLTRRARNIVQAPTVETFIYDALNRLKSGQLTQINGVSQGSPPSTISLKYDQLGNVCSKNGKTYGYGPTSGCANPAPAGGPHQLVTVGSATYAYDNDGNQMNGGGRTLGYNALNQLINASAGSASTTFLYTPDGDRFQRVDNNSTTTWYVGNTEILRVAGNTTETRRYLAGAAIDYVRTSGNNETRYLFKDHLGSTDTVVNAQGGLIESASFDAHGTLRNPITWNGVYSAPTSTMQGFTGHEEVYSLNLTHMNGRIYDPSLGRMLQADPMTGPGNQSLNRYSYVVNNPLSLTDPSGYSWWHRLDPVGYWLNHNDPISPWHQIQWGNQAMKNPYVRFAAACVAAYFTAGAASAWAFEAGLGQGAAYAVGGAAGGFVSGGIEGQNLQSAFYGAALGSFGNYLSGGTYFGNPIESAAKLVNAGISGNYAYLGNSALHFATSEASQYAERRIAKKLGVRPEVLNLELMALSVVGNDVIGSRFQENDKEFSQTGNVGFRGYLNRTGSFLGVPGSLFFDTVDVMLAYQGLPTASYADFVYSGYAGHAVTGHSLGTLDAIRAVDSGQAPSAVLYAVPFGNVAPSAAQVYLGDFDLVNGGYLGKAFNWNATICATGINHAYTNYLATCN
jgi:RHS repeat-associated protein